MKEQQKAYAEYTKMDFFEDDRFIRSVLHPSEEAEDYWNNIREVHPGKAPLMEEARLWILLLNKQALYTGSKSKQAAWDTIYTKIDKYNDSRLRYVVPLKRVSRWTGSIAAVFLLLWVLRDWSVQGEKTMSTDFGKLKELVLPDESVVTLNGHSSVHYTRGWRSDKPRELWLQGEAYFQVKHVAVKNRLQQSDSFRVHVNDLNLTVTGTKFNVRSRRAATEITLLEGGLRIEKTGKDAFTRMLKPGDVFVYEPGNMQVNNRQRKPESNNAWTKREMDLDGYTLREILQVLEDTYGYRITLLSPELADKRLTGTIPASSGEDILFVLQKVFNLTISRNGNQLSIIGN